MLNKKEKEILNSFKFNLSPQKWNHIGNGFTCFKGSTHCFVNVTGPITFVHKRLCGHKLQYIYQIYSAMFSGYKKGFSRNPLVRSQKDGYDPKVALTGLWLL